MPVSQSVSTFPAFSRLKKLVPWRGKTDDLTSATIALLASFAMVDRSLDPRETSVMLDILHGSFPEIDHTTLNRRLKRAIASQTSISRLAGVLKKKLSLEKRTALALQTLVLALAGSGDEAQKREKFIKFCHALDIPDIGETLLLELDGKTVTDFPYERITFGVDGDVSLPPEASEYSFIIYRSSSDVWLRNTGRKELWGRGHSLGENEFLRLIEHSNIAVPGWRLGYEDLIFFLEAARGAQRTVLYLGEEQGELLISRNRSRLHALRLELGLNARITRLKNADIFLDPRVAIGNETLKVPYHSIIQINGSGAMSLERLRSESLQAGGRIKLSSERRDCQVTNMPSQLRTGDLLITPDLAGPTVLRIISDPENATGRLEVLRSDGNISINGQNIRNWATLRDGALIRISKEQSLRCRFSEGILDEERTLIRDLKLTDLSHTFRKGTVAFENISLSLTRGEMMAIIGPSGCGKSSLLTALAGHLKPARGDISINGASLYSQRDRLLPFIAQMPQEEALSPQLTVREHLRHAFCIRRPHLPASEQKRRIEAVMNELGLERLSGRKVGEPGDKSLSGGERGRLNLALDLGSSAELFLFDEPTSGLSSKDSEHLAQTLRSLARDKLVICSLHRPGSRVLDLFDKVLLLDTGGKMAFFGTPQEMSSYFKKAAEELELPIPYQTAKTMEADFVFDVLEAPLQTPGVATRGITRRFPGEFWQERFESQRFIEELGSKPSQSAQVSEPAGLANKNILPRPRKLGFSENLSLLRVHLQRSFFSKFRSQGTLHSILLETPLLAFLIGLTLRASPQTSYHFSTALHIPIFLFLTVTVGMFLGLTNSATEILRDSSQLRRERNYRRGTIAYILAKFSTLSLLASLQCSIFLLIGHALLDIHGMFWSHWFFMTLTTCCGTALSLVISALVTSQRAALNAVPLLLLPQILLAGALVPFGEMNRGLFKGGGRARDEGGEPVPARFMPLRYAFEGILVSQATQNPYESFRTRIQDEIEKLKDKETLDKDEEERFDLLKNSLMRLAVAEAEDISQANTILSQIKTAASNNNTEALEKIELSTPDAEDLIALSGYYANERIDKLLSKAEANRQDYRESNSGPVFFARKKSWLGINLSTTLTTTLILGILTAVLLAISTLITRQRYIGKLN